MIPHVLSIAGSDPSGGAGIQADLKTFSALGCYGMSVVTALTAQNTTGVRAVHDVPADFVAAQIEAVFDDVRVDAVKIGMVANADVALAIADVLTRFKPSHVVLDPVMVASSGGCLLAEGAVDVLKTALLPLADIITPNIPEAEILLGCDYGGDSDDFAAQIFALGGRAVLLKGGHAGGRNSDDVFMSSDGDVTHFPQVRIDTKNTHGTGCTLSSAVASFLARGMSGVQAVGAAKNYITAAIQNADKLDVGHGHGPVHHFHGLWD